jgi:hypothetical protein
LTPEERLELDGAFKKVARAQGAVGRLADEGSEKAMASVDQNAWDGYFGRLRAARGAADAAQNELEEVYRRLMPEWIPE